MREEKKPQKERKEKHSMKSYEDVWNVIMDGIKATLTHTSVRTFFDECSIHDICGSELILFTPSTIKRDVIENRYLNLVKKIVDDVFSDDFKVTILDNSGLEAYEKKKNSSDKKTNTMMEFTFDTFVVGSSNKFAHAAALGVAENPSGPFNPLFIYGESGLGKTHLLYAIANYISRTHPDFKIVYVKGNDFTDEVVEAIRAQKTREFREKYRDADLLLVDDIHLIAGKIQTQEEFFNTFNTLFEAHKQIVLTADRPPKDMARLEDRLKTRFEWGLLADIQPPDIETRMAIIKNKAQQLDIELPDDVVNYIAENVTANVRQLEGTVKKIMAYRDMMFEPITVESVARAIRDMYKEKSAYTPSVDKIITEVASFYRLTPDELRGKSRSRDTVNARQVAMYLIRKLTNFSLENIGMEFGNRDHSTVINSIRKVENAIRTPGATADIIRDIEQNLNSEAEAES